MKFKTKKVGLAGVGLTKHIVPESAAVIALGDPVTRDGTTGDLEAAGAASAQLAIAQGSSAAGETTAIPVFYGDSYEFEATADANYIDTMKGTTCDMTAAGLVDVGTSSTNVFQIVGGEVGTTNVRVRLNSSILA